MVEICRISVADASSNSSYSFARPSPRPLRLRVSLHPKNFAPLRALCVFAVNSSSAILLHVRPAQPQKLPENPTADDILNTFLDYLTNTDTEPYDHQEEAILELFAGNNVILNTPIGSGKSLVALALQLAVNFSVSDFRISAFTLSPSAACSVRKTSA